MFDGSEYRAILDKEIIQKSKSIIFSFNPENDVYQFKPYETGVTPLGEALMEYGFPVDAIRNLEDKFAALLSNTTRGCNT